MSDPRLFYSLLVGLMALQRLFELAVSRRHRRRLLARGGVEEGAADYRWMVLLHTAFLSSCVAEPWLLERPLVPLLASAMLVLLLLATALRYWAIATLGERWTTRVICLPGAPLVTGGPYRYLRHPNYLAVVVEFAALPLVHTAWLTAAIFSLANLVVLRRRIAVEEAALARYSGMPPRQ